MDNPQYCPEQDGLIAPAKLLAVVKNLRGSFYSGLEVLACQDQHICGCLRDEDS